MTVKSNNITSARQRGMSAMPFKAAVTFILLLFAWCAAPCSAAGVVYPERPNLTDARNYIADPYGYLPPSARTEINERLQRLREETTCECAICIVKTTGDETMEDYAYNLFRKWGLGKKDNNNGVLIVIAPGDRKSRIEVGSGAEGVLTDISCANIIRNDIRPAMVGGDNIGQALNSATESIYDAMTNPAVAEELRSKQGETPMGTIKAINKTVIREFIGLVALLVFIFTLVMFIIDFRSAHHRDNYRRAMIWRNHIPTYWWSVLLSLGTSLPIAVVAYILYRYARDVTEICTTCGGKMKKLSEKEDNTLLSSSQDFEEQLGTVDYDVWLCPDCGTVERFPYVERQLKYKKCPDCGTIAMNLVCDKVIEPPTTRKAGEGERTYQCQYCRHIRKESYQIPRKQDPSAAIAAGAVIGSMMGRGGGGGGFGGGGSFGGGHSSGGGATGGW